MTGVVAVSIAAFAGAPHCLGMCGPLAAAASSERGWVPYHAGRLITYAGLGGLAGAFGSAIPGPPWVITAVSAVFLVGFAASLAGWLPEPKFAIPGVVKAGSALLKRRGPLSRLGFGMVNGLLPCGLLYGTLAVPISTGSAVQGMGLMALFGVLTALPLSAAALGGRVLLQKRPARLVLAALVLVTGLSGLAGRGGWFVEEPAPCHHTP